MLRHPCTSITISALPTASLCVHRRRHPCTGIADSIHVLASLTASLYQHHQRHPCITITDSITTLVSPTVADSTCTSVTDGIHRAQGQGWHACLDASCMAPDTFTFLVCSVCWFSRVGFFSSELVGFCSIKENVPISEQHSSLLAVAFWALLVCAILAGRVCLGEEVPCHLSRFPPPPPPPPPNPTMFLE